jgi:DNA-binding CsgD family transcriptional regulator
MGALDGLTAGRAHHGQPATLPAGRRAAPPGLAAPVLRGRTAERRVLADLLQLATAGSGSVLVDGLAGTGKSRLLAETAALAAAQDFFVARCGSRADAGTAPLRSVLSALDSAASIPHTGPLEPDAAHRQLLTDLSRRLHDQAAGPVLVVLDNVEAADDAMLRRLRSVTRRLAPLRVAWLFSRRSGHGSPLLAAYLRELVDGGARRIELGALPDDAGRDVLTDLLGAIPDIRALGLADGAGGNPRLLVELGLGLREEGLVEVVAGRARLVTGALPRRLHQLAGAQLAQLDPAARKLAELTAAAGGNCPTAELARRAATSPAEVLAALAAPAAADVLVERAGTVRFRSDLLGRAVAEARGTDPMPRRPGLDGRWGPPRGADEPRPAWSAQPPVPAGDTLPGLHMPPGSAAAAAPLKTDSLLALRAPTALAASVRSRQLLSTGDVAEAVAAAEAGLAEAQVVQQELLVPLALVTLATVALRRGDLAATADYIDRCNQLADGTDAIPVRVSWLAGQLDAARGATGWAMDRLLGVYDGARALRLLLTDEPVAAGWLVRNALAAEDRRRALAVTVRTENLARHRIDDAGLTAAAAHARGLLDRSAAELDRAAAGYPDPWARSSAAEDIGGLLLAGPDRQLAISHLEAALDGYEAGGAGRDAARVRSRLRQVGIRRRHWSRTDGPASGWASLTGTERAVADLVADGLTNRQVAGRMFLSPHTVAFHLRHIFRKLEIASRVELARLLARRTHDT